MKRKDEAGARGASAFLARPLILAVIAILLIGVYIFFIAEQDPPSSELPEDVGARPTGAGTLPDGAVDERIEGQANETSTDDFINDSSAGDLRPEILNPNLGPDPVTDAEDLDVPERINEGVVDPGPPDQ